VDDRLDVENLLKILSSKFGEEFSRYVFDDKTGKPRSYLQYLIDGRSASTMRGLKTELHDGHHQKPLDDDIGAVLFRDGRELLVNVVKHAQAEKVSVSIYRTDTDIYITAEDNGKGFDPIKPARGPAKRAEFGPFSIRERLEQLGGLFEIDSVPGRGCRIMMTALLKKSKTDNVGCLITYTCLAGVGILGSHSQSRTPTWLAPSL